MAYYICVYFLFYFDERSKNDKKLIIYYTKQRTIYKWLTETKEEVILSNTHVIV